MMSRFATATTSIPALIARDMAVAVYDTSIRASMKKKNRPATAWYPVKKQKEEVQLIATSRTSERYPRAPIQDMKRRKKC